MMENDVSNVRTLERGLMVLDSFTQQTPTCSLIEIAHNINLSPSTTSRMVATLCKYGYLKRDPLTLRYSLGYKLANLGAICLSTEDLRDIAHPFLISLRDYYNESVGLYVINRTERICIDCVHSTQPLRRVIQVGTPMRLTRGAAGKLLLAYQPEEFIRSLLLHDPFVSMAMLEEIRATGYATSRNEHEQGLCSVAAPVFNAENQVASALFISGPASRISPEQAKIMGEKCREVAFEISTQLGYAAPPAEAKNN